MERRKRFYNKNEFNYKRKSKNNKRRELKRKRHRLHRCADCLVIKNNRQAGFAFEKAPSGRAFKKGFDHDGHKKKKTACLFEKNIGKKILSCYQKNRTQEIAFSYQLISF